MGEPVRYCLDVPPPIVKNRELGRRNVLIELESDAEEQWAQVTVGVWR